MLGREYFYKGPVIFVGFTIMWEGNTTATNEGQAKSRLKKIFLEDMKKKNPGLDKQINHQRVYFDHKYFRRGESVSV